VERASFQDNVDKGDLSPGVVKFHDISLPLYGTATDVVVTYVMHVLLSLLPVCTSQINEHILRKDYSDLISGKINTQMEIQGQQQSTKHALNNKQFSSDKVFSVTSPDFLSIHSHFPGSCKISWHFQVFFSRQLVILTHRYTYTCI